MAFEIPTQVPQKFTAGDSFQVRISSIDFPPSLGWTLSISLRGPSKADADATVDGSDYLFSIDAATTKTWAHGEYWWQLRVSNSSGETHTVSKGRISILTDFSTVTDQNFSDKSIVEQTLDGLIAILAVKQGCATASQNATASRLFTKLYILDGVRVENADASQVIMLIEKYQRMADRERRAEDHLNGKKRRNRVYTRFV